MAPPAQVLDAPRWALPLRAGLSMTQGPATTTGDIWRIPSPGPGTHPGPGPVGYAFGSAPPTPFAGVEGVATDLACDPC